MVAEPPTQESQTIQVTNAQLSKQKNDLLLGD